MKILLLTLSLVMTLCLLLGGLGRADAARPALVVVLLPGTSLQDWRDADAPYLHRLMQTGAIGIMNTRTAHQAGQTERETPGSALLTLGAGARASGAGSAESFMPASAPAPGLPVSVGDLFLRRTGQRPSRTQAVCLNWPLVQKANQALGYDLRLGSLADTLVAHGVSVAAGGGPNADWVAAGSPGTVRHVPNLTVRPGLCLIWDAGSDITAADAVMGAAAVQATRNHCHLLVLSPYAGNQDYGRNEHLTPLLLWGTGVPAGLLSSVSTRQAGLVTNTDFAPSVADDFGIKRTEFRPLPFGYAWTAAGSRESIQEIVRLNSHSVQQAQSMRLLPYLAVVIGAGIFGLTWLTFKHCKLGLGPLVPLGALAAALFAGSAVAFGIVLLGTLILTALMAQVVPRGQVLVVITGVVAAALVVGMLSGDFLMHRSLLGYSAIEGARYYGIGNEAMGLLLGSALIVTAYLWQTSKVPRWTIITCLAGIVLLLGFAGAKAGGVLVSLAEFGTFVSAASGRRWSLRTIASLAAASLAMLTLVAFGDAFLGKNVHSHIGEAVRRVLLGGPQEALDIIRRKLAVEGRLAYHSAWAVLLWAGVFCTCFLWKRTPPPNQTAIALRSAGVVGVMTCLLFNDAGVIAAAIFVSVLWTEAILQKQKLPALGVSKAGRMRTQGN